MSDYIRVSKKKVKDILSLYTIVGLSQKEVAEAVFGEGEIEGITTYTLVQRVLHYLSINMEYRKDYKNEGLTPEIIDMILDNRTLAFPLAIPIAGGINPAIIFDQELMKCLGKGSSNVVVSKIKNAIVLAGIILLTFFGTKSYDDTVIRYVMVAIIIIPMIILTIMQGYEGRGLENSK